jgi:hypothetical protein
MQTIQMTQEFNAPQQLIFDYLSDHNNLSSVLNANITRIKDADGDNPNGLGSVRSIKLGIEILQETVVTFDDPNLIEYTISSNAPINYHLGRLEFSSPTKNKTLLVYTIQLESKFAIVDPVVSFLLQTTINNGLKKLAAKYK